MRRRIVSVIIDIGCCGEFGEIRDYTKQDRFFDINVELQSEERQTKESVEMSWSPFSSFPLFLLFIPHFHALPSHPFSKRLQ